MLQNAFPFSIEYQPRMGQRNRRFKRLHGLCTRGGIATLPSIPRAFLRGLCAILDSPSVFRRLPKLLVVSATLKWHTHGLCSVKDCVV